MQMKNETLVPNSLSLVTEKGMAELLTQAQSRILELEATETKLSSQVNQLQRKLSSYGDLVKSTLSDTRYADWFTASKSAQAITALNPMQRREIWLSLCTQIQANLHLQALTPHNEIAPQLKILVLATGGYGDMLYGTTVVRELYKYFREPSISVIAENTACEEVYKRNPYVYTSQALNATSFRELAETSLCLDIFDLIVEIRYAVSYARPPYSRVPFGFIAQTNEITTEWQKYVRGIAWPFRNNELGKAAKQKGLHQLDLVGITSGLPITKDSKLEFFFESSFSHPALAKSEYITVHHGADKNMVGTNGLQTKNLYPEQWARIVKIAQEAGFLTVQLGTKSEEQIHNVDVDLRGELTLEDTAYVISKSVAHIDTEGGLVHLARAVDKKSIVFFGPTPTDFFGYPHNINIAPSVCGDCWWMTKSWAQKCPLGSAQTPCMSSHDVEVIGAYLKQLSQQEKYTVKLEKQKTLSNEEFAKNLSKLGGENRRLLLHIEDINLPLSVKKSLGQGLPIGSEKFFITSKDPRSFCISTSIEESRVSPANAFLLSKNLDADTAIAFSKFPSTNSDFIALSNLITQLSEATTENAEIKVYLTGTSQSAEQATPTLNLAVPPGNRFELIGTLMPHAIKSEEVLELSISKEKKRSANFGERILEKIEAKLRG
jgi:ADP-heptose:LPS heptosyltransferase